MFKQRNIWVILALFSVAVVVYIERDHIRFLRRDVTLLPQTAPGWPANRTWTFRFHSPPSGETLATQLCFRANSRPWEPRFGKTTEQQVAAMTAEHAQTKFGTAILQWAPESPADSGTVTIQLLDLSEVGIASTKPDSDLRLLASMAVPGVSADLTRDNVILPPGRIAGFAFSPHESAWANDELYLMTFYLESEGKQYRYDAFIQCKPVTGPQ